MTPIPEHLQPHLTRELDEGEPLLWSAQPIYRVLKRNARRAWFALGFIFGLLIAFLILLAWLSSIAPTPDQSNEPWTYLFVAGLVFLVWIAFFPFFILWAKSVAHKTIYAITNKRAIILTVNKDGSTTERDYRDDELTHLARQENPDGTGTLIFESARGAGATTQSASRHRFQAIDNVIEVERLLRKQFGDA